MASIGYPSSSGSSMGGSTAASGSGSSGTPAAPPASYGSSSGAGSWSGLGAGRSAHAQVVRWLSDLEKTVIVSNFEKRGWAKGSAEGACVQSLPCSTYALHASCSLTSHTHFRILHFAPEYAEMGVACGKRFLFFSDGDWNFYW